MIILDKENFENEVQEASGLVLVDYWNESCEPCKALMPEVEALSESYADVKFCKLNTSKARRLAIKQRIMGLPNISLYKDGEKIDEVTKENASKESIEAMIKKYR
ncbi:thioredoxin TrxA [Haloplasma contractile]|uniref:Thioredoxin n=1 Tax=Haloplasma contractile SSD-17B TaxID=1033810 RepID=U2FK69_9MOLU|nr:thioredoxin family protein [Haloplasma contractile]ERJ13210.1 Thioredoxin domain-containing protein Posttranslational modification [Haloplasma contractile SSD-17B]